LAIRRRLTMNRRGFLRAVLALPAAQVLAKLATKVGGKLPEQITGAQVTVANGSRIPDLTFSGISAARVRARIDELREPALLIVQNPISIELSRDARLPGGLSLYEDWYLPPNRDVRASFSARATEEFRVTLDVERLFRAGPVTVKFDLPWRPYGPLFMTGDVVAMEFTDYSPLDETCIWHVELSNVSDIEC